MDLKEFITETLVSVNDGIKEAINKLDATDGKGAINPHWSGTAHWKDNLRIVEFDIAVTASDAVSGKGKAAIEVLSIGFGGEASKSTERGSTSRVKFSIPVVFPVTARDPTPR